MQKAESNKEVTIMKLIDTHCDTAIEILRRGESIVENSRHISLNKAKIYDNYAQFFACWACEDRTDEEGYQEFLAMTDNMAKEIEMNSDKLVRVDTFTEMKKAWDEGKTAAFFAVEDARLLCGDINRLYELKRRGVKYLTIMWGGHTHIGASHDVLGGLTDFGKEVVQKCFELGICPDVSHSNEQVTSEIIEMAYKAGKPVIASHSNSYSVWGHTRNLRDEHFKAIKELGGIVGISLCCAHLRDGSTGIPCTVDHIVQHIDRYVELGGEDIIGLGCDLDGTRLPVGITGLQDLPVIADALKAKGYSDEFVDKIFYKNYYNFIERNFK